MVKRCSVCNHLSRSEIDRGLMQAVPYRALAGQFNLSPSALCRHTKHLARALDAPAPPSGSVPARGTARRAPIPPSPQPSPPGGGRGRKRPRQRVERGFKEHRLEACATKNKLWWAVPTLQG